MSAPPPDLTYYKEGDASVEVFRVFCRRVAKDSYPEEVDGDRFYPICDGMEPDGKTPRDAEDEQAPQLRALLRRRPEIMASMQRLFAETPDDAGKEFKDGELKGFLRALVPLYDKPFETIPTATRGIAELLAQLVDPNDARANKVLATVERLVKRKGYRTPDQNLGAVRALFTYPGLDTLAQTLLPVISSNGPAHEEWVAVLNAAALELADEPVVPADLDGTTLHTALDILLREDPKQKGSVSAVPVLKRVKGSGDALATGSGSSSVTPYPVLGEDDNAQRDKTGMALSGGAPAYQTIDASQTLLAALMREVPSLIGRGDAERSPLENLAHGLKPLLGPVVDRTETIGKNNYAFSGPDVTKSPLLDLAHAAAIMLKYDETEVLLKALEALIREHENEAMGLDFAALAIADLAKESQFDGAKLNGPHELWDDLIAVGERMLKRPALLDGLIRSFLDPRSGAQGQLFATWMRYKDQVSYPNSPSDKPEDINKPVDAKYSELVDRDEPDVGFNRSIWQRTMSLINALNGVKVCNKDGAILTANTGIGLLTFPVGDLAMAGYKKCDLIEIQDAVEIYSKALTGRGGFAIKDAFASILAAFGAATGISGSVGAITEKESTIVGFDDTPSPGSLARFIFAPRNDWLNKLFDPQLTKDNLPIAQFEPNALFPLEIIDDKTSVAGKPDNFYDIGIPLLTAFDVAEARDPLTTLLTDGYMFGHLLSVFHKHWPQRTDGACPATAEPGKEGCTQSQDPAAPLYAAQTGLVTYEELLAQSLDEQQFVELLHNAAIKLATVKVSGPLGAQVDGITALANFLTVALKPDPTLKKRDGSTTSASNLCKVTAGTCANNVGRFIPVLSPMVMLGDALKGMDDAFTGADQDRLAVWREGRSGMVDQLLAVDRSGNAGNASYKLRDRTAYNIALAALPWLSELIDKHRAAGDLVSWADGLSARAEKIMRHPLASATVDLLDAFWPEAAASGQFTEVAAYLMDEANESAFVGMLTALADTATLLDRDSNLSPAIQFAALGLAPNAFQAIDGSAVPNGDKSVAYAGLELTGGVVKELNKDKAAGTETALSKLLNNLVISDQENRSCLEVLIDATADVNRPDDTALSSTPLTAAEDREVFGIVKSFLADDDQEKRSLERLYSVIQGRKVK